MDVARPATVIRNKKIRQVIVLVLTVLTAALLTLASYRMKPSAPALDRSAVWIDQVKRGPMLREVRGVGTLVPEEVRWIPALRDGLIERINVKPGDSVRPETILLEI